ncbi:N-6 adenine-specific DNA methyltransferas-like protein 2 [Pseudovirgaria hyperparasitica]|uniref:Protein-lysine N-methyltransferase EFM5 n=1 Tax=Pseudovirgaria hyperparasitica TaxID=470096 RepID=A0A6A6W5E3_9PEZI|nr:N-6 adenine-specific DNA methyltransferas-like protein 2 [Pseudovirgaria hyperparasitica]KAF2758148.1 N-6 adenine-specific DNA methyltransferas-like protein 2 [Pseudovirgaria hyperparasitica]
MMDDDDIPSLPADALQALQEFYNERDTRAKQFDQLKAQAEQEEQDRPKKWSMEYFTEDWNASQFWYTDECATTYARQLLDSATDASAVAVVSAPSVFIQLKNLLSAGAYSVKPRIMLFEYDERFAVFKGEYTYYDFANPTQLPGELKGKFDRIIFDPPFLNENTQTKTAITVRWLSRNWNAPGTQSVTDEKPKESLRLIGSTGERMKPLVSKLYGKVGIRTTNFEVEHAKGLSNEFHCYANFECDAWKWAA